MSIKKSIPTNKKLYSKSITFVKSKVKVWPSEYASGQVVQRYKRLGGKYSFGKNDEGLTRWFKEKWVNVCSPTKKSCSKSTKKYPYCRPSVRVTPQTPKTIHEIPKTKLKELCKKKKNSNKIFV